MQRRRLRRADPGACGRVDAGSLQGDTTQGTYLMNGVDGVGNAKFDTGTWTVLAQ